MSAALVTWGLSDPRRALTRTGASAHHRHRRASTRTARDTHPSKRTLRHSDSRGGFHKPPHQLTWQRTHADPRGEQFCCHGADASKPQGKRVCHHAARRMIFPSHLYKTCHSIRHKKIHEACNSKMILFLLCARHTWGASGGLVWTLLRRGVRHGDVCCACRCACRCYCCC